MGARTDGYRAGMDSNSEPRDPAEPDAVQQPGSLRRLTEQGDDLTEEHSLSERYDRRERPYAPPRQPSQDPPG